VFKYPDGSYYEGDFLDDLFDGHGILYKADGSIIKEGFWDKGNFVGKSS
jgi:hypothetical protein